MHTRESEAIAGVVHLDLDRIADPRGFLMEAYRESWLPGRQFVQANLSGSGAGVLRGLHYHLGQDDLWTVADGEAAVGLVDLREGSPTYLSTESLKLAGSAGLFIPAGVGHGFYAVTPLLMVYLVTALYDGTDERGVLWNDPELGVAWPAGSPLLSERDRHNPRWGDVPPERRPGGAA